MKTIKFFAAAMAAVAMLSCSKEGVSKKEAPMGSKATITIGITTEDNSRATGIITSDADNKINNFVAFPFKADGRIDGNIISSSDGNQVTQEVTNATTEVYVIANAPAAMFATVKTKAQLMDIVGNLADGSNCTQTSTSGGNVWAAGKNSGAIIFAENSTTHVYEASIDVPISFVSARINLTIDNQMIKTNVAGALKIESVSILNAVTETKFFGTSLMPAIPAYYAGIDMVAFNNKPASYAQKAFLKTNYVSGTNDYHFYVFENDATSFPTTITLESNVFKGQVRYFPVQFNLSDAKKVIQRGKSYNVTMTLTGSADPSDPDEPGTTDPTDPYVKANLTVEVSVQAWVPEAISKDF